MAKATVTESRRRAPLALRIFLLCVALIVLAVASAVAVTQWVGARIAQDAVNETLDDSAAAQHSATERRLQLIERTLELMAGDPTLARYVSAALGGDPGLGNRRAADLDWARGLLRERQQQFGFDLALLLDPEGRPLARSDAAEAFADSFAEDALIQPALRQLLPQSGFWRHRDRLFQAAVMPLSRGDNLVGFLLLALAVDDRLCTEIAAGTKAEVAFWLPGSKGLTLAASSLPQEREQSLGHLFSQRADVVDAVALGRTASRTEFNLESSPWVARLMPIMAGEPALGAVTVLASKAEASRGYRQMLNLVLLAGAGSLVLALPLSLWLARRILRPVRRLADAVQRAAGGDYAAEVAITGSDELARLGQAFDSLLSDLREKNDVEEYVTTFSRFLPDTVEVPAPTQPVLNPSAPMRESEGVVLALEYTLQNASTSTVAEQTLQLSILLQRLAKTTAGQLLHSDGQRAWLFFNRPDGCQLALRAAKRLLDENDPARGQPTLAIGAGGFTAGGVQGPQGPVTAFWGPLRFQLDRLLCESTAGRALLSRGVGDCIREQLGTEALQIAEGTLTRRRYYALRLEGLKMLPGAESPGATTVATAITQGVAALPSMPEKHTDYAVGARLGGRYEVLALLGEGGMGAVYKARDLELDDIVALRMLTPGALAGSEQLDRLKDEIRLACKITHPNVSRIFACGEIDGQPFIAMEYVRGATLRALLDQSGRLPYCAGLRIARQLCAGLAATHEAGVLHRNIKPESLILEAGGKAKLMDPGIARPSRRALRGHTVPGICAGAPSYCAPEQLTGEDVDQRADIYASGVLMSEMFCGGLPYEGNSNTEIYLAQMQSEPVRPSALWAGIPATLEAIILRCIARRREDRFQSAAELGAALSGLRG